jgi:hypothetical protein
MNAHANISVLVALLMGTLGVAASACSTDGASSAFRPDDPNGADAGNAPPIGGDEVPTSDSDAASDGGSTTAFGRSTALHLLHASYDLPAVRVCFEGAGALPALPRSNVMPNSNVPGLDVGRVVRIGNIATIPVLSQKPKVHLFVESAIRSNADAACSALLADPGLKKGEQRFEATFDDASIDSTGPLVLVIEGCANAATPQAKCTPAGGKTRELSVRAVGLPAPVPAAASTLRWLPVNVAPELSAAEVWFGVSRTDATPRASANWGQTGPVQLSPFDRSNLGNFATHLFGVRADASELAQQSMADTQDLSLPGTVPSEFYVPEASMALFVVGFKSGADAAADPARSLHVLAVPIAEDAADAGDR